MTKRARGVPHGLASIRFRIVAAFLVALTAMAGTQLWLVAQQQPVNDSLRLVAEGYLRLSKKVAQLKRDQERVQRDLQRLNKDRPRPVTGETSAAEIYTEELAIRIGETRIIAESMRGFQPSSEELAVLGKTITYLDSVESLFKTYEQQSADYLGVLQAGGSTEEKEQVRRPLRGTAKRLADELDKLERTLDGRITALTEASQAHTERTTAIALGLVALTALMTFLLVAAVLYALRPIGRLTEEVQRVAGGDYSGRVEVGGNDEVGLLAAEFNAMAQAIELRDTRLKDRAAELRRLSRYLASVLDSLEDALVVVEQGVVTLSNPAATRTWGAAVDSPPPEVLAAALEQSGRHDLGGPAGRRYSARTVTFGERGVVAVISDVTEQVRAQEALARSERLALVGQMLAQITHEVRNPLNALSLNAELLGDEIELLDKDHRTEAWEILDMIAAEVERLTAVTGHYLQLARRPPARLVSEDPNRLVAGVVRLLEPELEARGVTLAVQAEPLGPHLVDGNQLRRALINVVRNGAEAGATRLDLTVTATEDELILALQDNGPGMDEEQIQRAFDPFYSTKDTGTGLGLAITRQILEDHGGEVRVDSSAGRGTTVALVVPRRATDEPPDDAGVFEEEPVL